MSNSSAWFKVLMPKPRSLRAAKKEGAFLLPNLARLVAFRLKDSLDARRLEFIQSPEALEDLAVAGESIGEHLFRQRRKWTLNSIVNAAQEVAQAKVVAHVTH